jgi:RNA polymerase sigma-70 factor, ECF subfamily
MDPKEDHKLVECAKDGDVHAFETLIETHYLTVYRIAFKWCGIKEDAEDITQDVFVKVARKLQMFKGRSSFKTWLYRMTMNTAKDYYRKQSTKRLYEAAFTVERGADNPGPDDENRLDAAKLYGIINTLPPKQKAAILLVCGEGLSHREASRILKCSETTVSWRIFQARKKLKRLWEHEL